MDVQVLVALKNVTLGMICNGPAKHWVILDEDLMIDVHKNGCLSVLPFNLPLAHFGITIPCWVLQGVGHGRAGADRVCLGISRHCARHARRMGRLWAVPGQRWLEGGPLAVICMRVFLCFLLCSV